jgi:hypothetical protein
MTLTYPSSSRKWLVVCQNQGTSVVFSRHPVYCEVNTGIKLIKLTLDSGVLVSHDVVPL